jgi:hypothetical protein
MTLKFLVCSLLVLLINSGAANVVVLSGSLNGTQIINAEFYKKGTIRLLARVKEMKRIADPVLIPF